MKSTKKIIIGLIAVIALLITIASALAAEPTVTYTVTAPNTAQNSNTVTLNKTQQATFNVEVKDNPDLDVSYQWFVNGLATGAPEHKGAGTTNSSLLFDANGKSVGPYKVSVVINGPNPPYSKAWDVTVQDPQPVSPLSITKVKVNGKTTGKLSMSDLNKIEVEVSNDHDKKMEPVTVTIRLLDEDGDELVDEEEEISKLSAGDEDSVEMEFDLSKEDLDEEEYTLKIEVEGEADNKDYSDQETQKVEVDRENDDIIITKVDLQNSQVLCSAPQTSLEVQVKNVGENAQDGARITVKNSALSVDLQRANIDLDDYAGSDNEYKTSFPLDLQDAKQGTYTLDVAVYSEDNDLKMDSEEVELTVECPAGTPSQEEQGSEQYADKELAAELQKKIDEYKALQESQATAAQGNFRESSSYVLLLGVLVAMMFFAAVLSATYVLLRKK